MAELILARSPYVIDNLNFEEGTTTTLTLSIRSANSVIKIYSFTFGSEKYINISPFLKDYLDDYPILYVYISVIGTAIGGGYLSEVKQFSVTDGYAYYEEGHNKKFSDYLLDNCLYAGSNDVIYRYEDRPLSIPLINPIYAGLSKVDVVFYKGDEVLVKETINFTSYESVHYTTESDYSTFQSRVTIDGGVYEGNECVQEFVEEFTNYDADRVLLGISYTKGVDTFTNNKELKVVPISECKYTPKKIVFLNKLGVKEDLWFFKKTTESVNSEKDTYRSNTISSYMSGDLSRHVSRDYNVNAKESLVLNTGFVPDSFSENFKQLMMSEKVWIYDDINLLPVNIKNSSLEIKSSVNDKLINYTIEIDYSFDKINNIF